MSSTDRLLVERWRTRRDPDAFAEITARYAGMVYATCRRILGDAVEAAFGGRIPGLVQLLVPEPLLPAGDGLCGAALLRGDDDRHRGRRDRDDQHGGDRGGHRATDGRLRPRMEEHPQRAAEPEPAYRQIGRAHV